MEDIKMPITQLRVLYFSNKGKMIALADALAKKLNVKADVIPPAHPCELERVVFILASIGKKTPDTLRRFCMTLNRDRTDYVAFLFDGDRANATDIINAAAETGAKVCEEKLFVNLGFSPSFLKILPDDIKNQTFEWADRILATIQ